MNTGNIKKILTLVALISVLTPCADVQAGLKINLKPKSSHEEKQTQESPEKATKEFAKIINRGASYPNDLDKLIILIGQGADVNVACDGRGHSALYIMKEQLQREIEGRNTRQVDDDKRVIAMLIDAGATENDVDLADRRKSSEKPTKQLIRTLRIGDLQDLARIERLIKEGADVNAVDNDGSSILSLAEKRGEEGKKVVAILVAAGARKDGSEQKQDDADTPENGESVAEWQKSVDKNTLALFLLLRHGSLEKDFVQDEVKKLIKHTNVNSVDATGNTPLFTAETRGRHNEKVVAMLVAAGAKKNDADAAKEREIEENKNREKVARATESLFKAVRLEPGIYGADVIIGRIDSATGNGADVNGTDENGNSVLFVAEQRGQRQAVLDVLIDAGAKKNDADAAKEREIEEIQNREKVARATKSLFEAVRLEPGIYGADIIGCIDSATKDGADVNATDENGNSVLFLAEQRGWSQAVLDVLIAAGAKKNDADVAKEREIAKEATEELIRTCKNFHLDTENLNALLAKGADVNATDKNGNSVLFLAECQGILSGDKDRSKKLIAALIAAGAKKNEADIIKGKEMAEKATPRLVAKCKGDDKYSGNEESDRKEFEQLIAQGADVNATDENGNSVLFICEKKNLRNFEKLLVNAGAKKNKVDATSELIELCLWCRKEKNPLSTSSTEEELKASPEKVQALIDSGADVNAHDKDGNSVLFLAELNENLEILPLLTQAGAKLDQSETEKLKEEATKKLFKLADSRRPENVKERVELYISWGGDVNAKNADGHSLLLMALYAQTVKSGLGSMTEAAMKDSATALGVRQESEDITTVMKALAGDSGEGLFSNPLCATLIAAGAEASKDEMTQIYFMNLKTGNWSAIKEFRDRHFDLRAEGKGGKNAFHVLSENQLVPPNESVVDALVKAGVNMERKAEFDDAFLTPLGYAIQNKHVETVRILLKHGANRKATASIKDVMGNRSISLIDLTKDNYNKAKRARDLAMTQQMTRDNVQLIKALDAAMRDYQQIISMLR